MRPALNVVKCFVTWTTAAKVGPWFSNIQMLLSKVLFVESRRALSFRALASWVQVWSSGFHFVVRKVSASPLSQADFLAFVGLC